MQDIDPEQFIIRIEHFEFDQESGEPSVLEFNLSNEKHVYVLILSFGNGLFEEIRAQAASLEGLRAFLGLLHSVGHDIGGDDVVVSSRLRQPGDACFLEHFPPVFISPQTKDGHTFDFAGLRDIVALVKDELKQIDVDDRRRRLRAALVAPCVQRRSLANGPEGVDCWVVAEFDGWALIHASKSPFGRVWGALEARSDQLGEDGQWFVSLGDAFTHAIGRGPLPSGDGGL